MLREEDEIVVLEIIFIGIISWFTWCFGANFGIKTTHFK
jgi:hypothetical protein